MTEISKVNNKELYEWYIIKIDAQLKELEQDLKAKEQAKKSFISMLEEHKEIINLCCNYTYDEIINSYSLATISFLQFDLSRINFIEKNVNISTIKSLCKILIKTNKIVRLSSAKVKELQNSAVAYCIFKETIDSFNLKIREKILEGYTLELGRNLKQIRIIKKARNKANINWDASNKLKALLISQGKTPYNKDTAPDGEHWFVYFTSDYEYWWYWSKKTLIAPHPNYRLYAFSPSSPAKLRLREVLSSNPYAKLNFTE